MVVLGFGNSAMDIAVELSRISDEVFLAVRRGFHVIPKYLRGKPLDQLSNPISRRLPFTFTRRSFEKLIKQSVGHAGGLRAADAGPQARRSAPDRLLGDPQPRSATAT